MAAFLDRNLTKVLQRMKMRRFWVIAVPFAAGASLLVSLFLLSAGLSVNSQCEFGCNGDFEWLHIVEFVLLNCAILFAPLLLISLGFLYFFRK
jgi:hypothetical protein